MPKPKPERDPEDDFCFVTGVLCLIALILVAAYVSLKVKGG